MAARMCCFYDVRVTMDTPMPKEWYGDITDERYAEIRRPYQEHLEECWARMDREKEWETCPRRKECEERDRVRAEVEARRSQPEPQTDGEAGTPKEQQP